MKQIVKLLTIALLLMGTTNAQRAQKIGLGIHAGYSNTDFTGPELGSKSGFVGGVSATFSVGKQFYIQPEGNFQQHNGILDKEFLVGDIVERKGSAAYKSNYLDIPLLVKYKFRKTPFSIYAGPQLGIKLSSKFQINNAEPLPYDEVRNTNFSGLYGLEYFVPVTPNSAVVFNARYQTGFTKVFKEDSYFITDRKAKINAFSMTVGYRF